MMITIYHDGSVLKRILMFLLGIGAIFSGVLGGFALFTGAAPINAETMAVLLVLFVRGGTWVYRTFKPKVVIAGQELRIDHYLRRNSYPLSQMKGLKTQKGLLSSSAVFEFSSEPLQMDAVTLSQASVEALEAWWCQRSSYQQKSA